MKYAVKNLDEKLQDKSSKLVKPRDFNNKEFRQSYRAWVKRQTWKHHIPSNDVNIIINRLFKNAAEALIERDGGVVLEGIGYFGFYISMQRRFTEIQNSPDHIVRPFYETDYYNYHPYMFTDVFPQNKLKGWSMELGFMKGVKIKKIKNRRHFKLYYKEIKAMYRKNYNI